MIFRFFKAIYRHAHGSRLRHCSLAPIFMRRVIYIFAFSFFAKKNKVFICFAKLPTVAPLAAASGTAAGRTLVTHFEPSPAKEARRCASYCENT